MKIAIAGKKAAAENYVRYVQSAGLEPLVTLNSGEIAGCDALLLPGGGDITPAFFGEKTTAPAALIRSWTSCSSRPWICASVKKARAGHLQGDAGHQRRLWGNRHSGY